MYNDFTMDDCDAGETVSTCTVKDFAALHLIPTFTVLYKQSLMYLIC
jgi:hypothetical protein